MHEIEPLGNSYPPAISQSTAHSPMKAAMPGFPRTAYVICGFWACVLAVLIYFLRSLRLTITRK